MAERTSVVSIESGREPRDLLGGEPQLFDRRVVERQLVRHRAEEYSPDHEARVPPLRPLPLRRCMWWLDGDDDVVDLLEDVP